MGLRQNLLKDGFTPALNIFTREETDALYRGYREYVDRCLKSAYNIVWIRCATMNIPRYSEGGELKGDLRFRVHLVARWDNLSHSFSYR